MRTHVTDSPAGREMRQLTMMTELLQCQFIYDATVTKSLKQEKSDIKTNQAVEEHDILKCH